MTSERTGPTQPAVQVKWAEAVAEHDYSAAEAYLSLKLSANGVAKSLQRLRKAQLTTRRANDILRAAGLTAAPLDDPGVMKYLIKAITGEPLRIASTRASPEPSSIEGERNAAQRP